MKCKQCGGELERKRGKSGGFGFVKESDCLVCPSCGQKHDLAGNPRVNKPSSGFGSVSAGPTMVNKNKKKPPVGEIPAWNWD